MAIVQSSLSEDLISRQEKAVLRGIYRASQLNEGLISLDKLTKSPDEFSVGNNPAQAISDDAVQKLRDYLRLKIAVALENTKVPANPSKTKSSTLEA